MIGSLRGDLLDRGADEILVEVGGIGYRVAVSPTTAVAIGEVRDEVLVFVHHHVREDADTLYGFLTIDERRCFSALLGAHGVGPAMALAILSIHAPIELSRILAEEDLDALCLVPGVGKKTAQRLLIELKSRLAVPDLDLRTDPAAGSEGGDGGSARSDVRDALAGLGYGPDEIRTVLTDLPDEPDASLLLKAALQRLAMAR
jgi:Holliday junction DNA helicase RuvA